MKTLGPLTKVPSCQGLTPLMWVAAKKYLVIISSNAIMERKTSKSVPTA